MRVFSIACLISVIAGLQLPFSLNVFEDARSRPHHSLLKSSDLPIDLSQYEDNMVVRVKKSSEIFRSIKENGYKIWGSGSQGGTIDVQIHSDDAETFFSKMNGASPQIIIKDLPQAVYESFPDGLSADNYASFSSFSVKDFVDGLSDNMSSSAKLEASSEVFFKQFRPLASINAWLNLLVETYPEIVTLETIGETYEGRPLQVVHVSIPSEDLPHEKKRTIVVTGGVHAREWISVSSVLYNIHEILHHFETNLDDWRDFSKLDFLFIPVQNPDGYEYSWTTDRLWRKNRQPVEGSDDSQCKGIDIDHSYDFHWTASSDSACGEDYAGSRPFEAYESRVWDEYLNQTNKDHKIWGYIDLHSYSQEVLFPYAYSCNHRPRDEENLIELAYGIAKSIRLTSGRYYSVLPACIDRDSDLIPDMGSGTALDYMYHHKSYWAYQIKLRDNGSHGFLLPAKFIVPVGKEISAGLRYFCKFILSDD